MTTSTDPPVKCSNCKVPMSTSGAITPPPKGDLCRPCQRAYDKGYEAGQQAAKGNG